MHNNWVTLCQEVDSCEKNLLSMTLGIPGNVPDEHYLLSPKEQGLIYKRCEMEDKSNWNVEFLYIKRYNDMEWCSSGHVTFITIVPFC